MMFSIIVILAIMASGAFGGFVFAIFSEPREYKIRRPFSEKVIHLGYLGDLFIGAAAGLSIFFVAGPLFGIVLQKESEQIDYLVKVVSLGVLSGFAGIQLLKSLTSGLLKKVDRLSNKVEQIETSSDLAELIDQANYLLAKSPARAKIIFERVLSKTPNNRAALIGLARAYRRLNQVEKAIQLLDEAIHRHAKAERAYYLRACYKAISGHFDKKEVFKDLSAAIAMYEPYKQYACEDEDFSSLANDADFAKVTGLEPSQNPSLSRQ